MENNTDKKNVNVIDLGLILSRVRSHKKLFFITLPITFVLSCAYILCIPRYYITDVRLAPEMDNPMSGGTLGSLASSFGIDLGEIQSTDAITPLLYPDLMADNKFVSELFGIKVVTEDGQISTTYKEYMEKYQKEPFWYPVTDWILRQFAPKYEGKGGEGKFDPYHMSKTDDDIVEAIRTSIGLDVDKKTGIITISTEAQDPLVAQTLADSTVRKLQAFITDYRTSKARTDLKYYEKLANEAKAEYEKARRKYGSYSDSNTDVILESIRAEQTDLENDMQLKYNTYTTLMTQYQASKAKVQERTPAFTLLKGASVPIKPAGPKRMLFVLGMCILATFVLTLYSIKDMLLKD